MAQLDWYIRAGLKPRHLQLLVALGEYGQVGKVAAAMNVSTPAVSKTLAELEEGLGLKLFERSVRGVIPTPFGECMIRGAKTMMRGLAQVGDELHALSHGVTGKVRLGVLPSYAASLLPGTLVQLKRLSPATPVVAQEATMDVLLHALRAGEVELILGTLPRKTIEADIEEETLYQDRTSVVVRAGHPLAGKENVTWEAFSAFPWVLPPEGSLLREPLLQCFKDNGMSEPANFIETLSTTLVQSYLQLSDAIATMPESLASGLVKARMMDILPVALPFLVRPVGLVWTRGRPLSPSARLFRECLKSYIEKRDFAGNAKYEYL
ncbi:LysR substrate-binding domain-containing protein [Pandoraea anhela]|uniref:HTH-type transcriptional regulator GbpR n=1 Tax=Pandoraea anhela TaxID=2508295 RepID=A0A5E4X3J9_9BURK|nr:LysR substrate-binding domain-containing protein [Pandoraea anhela]VVE30863.1 HTH-type transcriptional regulator GbpR [Pandoraea anhela]